MKKYTLPALLLAAAMLVSCDAGTVIVPGSTATQTGGASTLIPTTDLPVPSAPKTTSPATTTAPVTYPVLYETPEITGTHDDVVPAIAIEKIVVGTRPHDAEYAQPLEDYLADMERSSYIIALVTPLELKTHEGTIRIAIDHVYVEHIPDTEIWDNPEKDREMIYSETTPVVYSSYMYGYGWHYTVVPELEFYADEIPITTTGGKYIMILELGGFILDGEDGCYTSYHLYPTILTWELDMASVPGSTGDNWNRPPYIGRAEDYYAFGFGDVWERYQAK